MYPNKWLILNRIINVRNSWKYLTVCKQMSTGSFKNFTFKLCVNQSYISCV